MEKTEFLFILSFLNFTDEKIVTLLCEYESTVYLLSAREGCQGHKDSKIRKKKSVLKREKMEKTEFLFILSFLNFTD